MKGLQMSKIYTRKGDTGITSLADGSKISKSSIRVEAYGALDELNAYMGMALNHCNDIKDKSIALEMENTLIWIQQRIFLISSNIANPQSLEKNSVQTPDNKDIHSLEKKIDNMTKYLPLQKAFILPGGSLFSSHLFICNTICRRAERKIIQLFEQSTINVKSIVPFINRLSDFLFTLARYGNYLLNEKEIYWDSRI